MARPRLPAIRPPLLPLLLPLLSWLSCASTSPQPTADSGGGSDARSEHDSGSNADTDARDGATTALFDLSETFDDLFALPFPNDLRRDTSGRIALGPKFEGRTELLQRYFDVIASGRFGFSSNGAIYFRFSAPIDEATLPASPTSSLEPSASVQLIDVGDDSPTRGQRVPINCRFIEAGGEYMGPNALALQPVYGFTLRPDTRYVALVTSALKDRDGVAVVAAQTFEAIVAPEPGDGIAAAAHATYAPLRELLARFDGDGKVVSAAQFTTGDHVGLLGSLREVVYSRAAPTATELVVADETASYIEIQGRFQSPNFQQGKVPFTRAADGGAIELDAEGTPKVAREESLRFSLSLPIGQMPAAGWPLVIYAHGTGGDFRSFIREGIATRLALVSSDGEEVARAAVIGIDQSLHGDRVPEGTDPTLTFLNIRNPVASVFNVVQGAADNFTLLRLAQALQLTSVPRKSGGPLLFSPAAKLDASKIAFVGHSQGAITGIPFAATEPDISAAVFSGAGGIGLLSLLLRDTPFEFAVLASVAAGETIDETHPVTTLIQQLMEPSDPINYAPLLLREVPADGTPKHVFLAQGIIDRNVPAPTIYALSVAGGLPLVGAELEPVAASELRGLETVALPASANLTVDGKKISAGLRQYQAPAVPGSSCSDDDGCGAGQYCDTQQAICRVNGHYVLFRRPDARQQVSMFLGTLFRDGLPTFVE